MKNQNNLIGEKSTFWKLTKDNAITIPIIQRDYAQGRVTDDVRQIREKFAKKLLGKLQANNPILLDFVYGTLEKPRKLSKGVTEYNEFIPLDGQQRLTTLFLLHWFLSLWNHEEMNDDYMDFKLHMIIDNVTSRFSYRTRTSSGDFCKSLISDSNRETILSNIKNAVPNPVSAALIDEGWFHYTWTYDPTISGMLVMLDTISNLFPKENQEAIAHDYYVKLTVHELVSFNLLFLNKYSYIDDQQQESVVTSDDRFSDELYIKMNSRGKPLSDFETFKSRFETFLRNHTNIDAEDFSQKIDHEWADSLWSIRNKVIPKDIQKDKKLYTRDNTDQMMMNLIKVVLANSYALTDDTQEEGLNVVFQTDAARKRKYDMLLTFYRYTELGILSEKNNDDDTFQDDNCKYGQNVKDAFSFVHAFISSPKSFIITSDFFDGWECIYKVLFDSIDGKQSFYNSISYYDRLYFYSFSQFCIICRNHLAGTATPNKDLNRWMHFIVNIIESAEINNVNDMQKFLGVIHGILSVFEKTKNYDIVSYLNGLSNYPDWSPIPQTQVREEVLKAKLINSYDQWENVIENGDNIPQWPGRSGYLLYFAGLSKIDDNTLNNMSIDKHHHYIETYREYYGKMSMLLNVVTDQSRKSEHLFERLLLSRRNYMRYENIEGYNCKVLSMMNSSFDGRSYSWRQMLQFNGIPDSKGVMANNYNAGVDALKQVLDAIELKDAANTGCMYSAILRLIKNPLKPIELWRREMLEESKLWDLAVSHFFWLGNNGDAWVPRKQYFNSNHYEVKSYSLFLNLIHKQNNKYHYYPHDWGYIYFKFKLKGTDNVYSFRIRWNAKTSSWNLKVIPLDADLNARPFKRSDIEKLNIIINYVYVNELRSSKGKDVPDMLVKKITYMYYNVISAHGSPFELL